MNDQDPGSKWDCVMDKLDVKSSDDFADFIDELRRNLATNKDGWENVTLESYLEAFAELMRGHKKLMLTGYTGETVAYAVMARMMQGAAIYE